MTVDAICRDLPSLLPAAFFLCARCKKTMEPTIAQLAARVEWLAGRIRNTEEMVCKMLARDLFGDEKVGLGEGGGGTGVRASRLERVAVERVG